MPYSRRKCDISERVAGLYIPAPISGKCYFHPLTICMLVNFAGCFVVFFSKLTFSNVFFSRILSVCRFVVPNLDPNCLQGVKADDTSRQRLKVL